MPFWWAIIMLYFLFVIIYFDLIPILLLDRQKLLASEPHNFLTQSDALIQYVRKMFFTVSAVKVLILQ